MSHDRLVAAYARMTEAGRKPTVRALRAEAGVATDAARAFLAELAQSATPPPAPAVDLTDAVAVLWAKAWAQAVTLARQEVAAELSAARDGEAAALAQLDATQLPATQLDAPETARPDAPELEDSQPAAPQPEPGPEPRQADTPTEGVAALRAERDALERELAAVRAELAQAHTARTDAEEQMRTAKAQAARAQATAETLSSMLWQKRLDAATIERRAAELREQLPPGNPLSHT